MPRKYIVVEKMSTNQREGVDRSWMYRHRPSGLISREFEEGVKQFLDFAYSQPRLVVTRDGQIQCPCAKCKNVRRHYRDDVELHLYKKGFVRGYMVWDCHAEGFMFEDQANELPSLSTNRGYWPVYVQRQCAFGTIRHRPWLNLLKSQNYQGNESLLRSVLASIETVYLNRNPSAKAILELVRYADGDRICYAHVLLIMQTTL